MPQATNIQANLQFTTASLNQSSRQVQQALGRITGQASEFQKSLDASTARVFAFGATTTVLQAVNQSFKKLIGTTIEVEKRLVEINSIFQASASEFNKFRNAIFQVAKDTGQAFSTVAEGAAELARQGLSAEETAKRLEAALILTRISGLDAEKSVKSLTAAINGFTSAGLSAEQIVNKIVAVDTAFAVSAQDLADGFSRAGSTAEDAGVSFDELLALITAVEQRTARGGAVIGNAFKSIFTRLSRGDTIAQLKELGVQIDANQTGIQKLQALSAALEEISDPTVASKIKELAGGVFQINVVSSTLKDLSSETSIFAGAAEVAANATNEAFEKNALLNKTLAAQINSLVASLTNFGEKVGQLTIAPLLGNLVKIAESVSAAFDKALDPEKGNKFIQGIFKAVGAFISGPGLVLITTAFLKITMLVAKFAKEGFQAVLNIGSAQEKQAKIQAGIVGLLQRDAQLRKVLNSSTATQAQKEQAVIQAIQRENQLLQQQQSLLQNIVGLAARRGVAGYSPSGGFTGKGGKRFAAGFQPSFADTAMEQISAKQHGYRAGNVYGTKLYDGQGGSFDAVVNSAETVKTMVGPNGKRGSFVIPPNGFAKGFVPNFAQLPLSLLRNKVKSIKGKPSKAEQGYIDELKSREAGKLPPIDVAKATKSKLPVVVATRGDENPLTMTSSVNGRDYIFKWPVATASQGELANVRKMFERDYDYQKFENMAKREALRQAQVYSRALGGSPVEPERASDIKDPKGFKGAITAALGSVFDSAMTAVVGAEQGNQEDGDFDIRGGDRQRLQMLFGPNINKPSGIFAGLGDYKFDADGVSVKPSMRDKTLKRARFKGKLMESLETKVTTKKRGRKGKAAGFIPNFANPLAAAIEREKAAGYSDSEIKVGQSNRVVSRDNPSGLMVYNKGQGNASNALKQHQGEDLPNVGKAAGFVPNFAIGGMIKGGKALLDDPKKFMRQRARNKEYASAAERKAAADNIRALRKEQKNIEKRIAQGNKSVYAQQQLEKNQKALSKATKDAAKLTKQRNKARNGSRFGMTKGGVGGFFALQMAGQMATSGEGDTIGGVVDKRQVGDIINYAAMGSAIAGPIGAAVGSAVGSVMGAFRQFKDTKDAQESKERTEKDINERIATQYATVLSKRSKSVSSELKGLATEESMALAQEMEALSKKIKDAKTPIAEVRKAAEEYKKAIARGEKNMEAFKEIKNLNQQIKILNASIARKTAEIDGIMIGNIGAAKEAERRIGIVRGIQNPNLTGVSKNIVDRGLQTEAAIASAQTAKQEDTQLRRQLMQEKERLGTSESDLKRSKEIDSLLAESAKNLQDKIDQGAVSLYNNLTAASAELETTIKKLAEQQSQAFNQRLDFASSLKGKQLLPETVIGNINALRNAKQGSQEQLDAAQRLAENRADLDALNPAIFKGILASQGMTPEQQEQLTRKVVESAVRKSLEGSDLKGQELENVVQAIVKAQQEGEPDMDQTKTDIKNLNQEIKETETRIKEFGIAFNAENLNKAIAKIGESLDAFAQGTLDATQILGAFQSINIKAEQAITEGNKRIAALESEMATAKTDRAKMQAELNTVKQGLGKGS